MTLWKQELSIAEINGMLHNTMAEVLDIRCEEVGRDFLRGSMVVDRRTHQPYGILHGGASVALAETLGSLAASMACGEDQLCFGLDINANHIRQAKTGRVYGTATPLHIGRSTQVWNIDIRDEAERRVCVSRLTVSVMVKPAV